MRHSPHLTPSRWGRYRPAVSDSGVRLNELLVALSLATDLGFGQPAEHMVRVGAARHAPRRAARAGRRRPRRRSTTSSILTYVGCPVYGNEAAALFGDDIDFRAEAVQTSTSPGFPAMMFMLRRAGSGASALNRAAPGRAADGRRRPGGGRADGQPLLGRGCVRRSPRARRRRARRDRAGVRALGRQGRARRPAGRRGRRSRRGSRTSPRRARCSHRTAVSTARSRWCAPRRGTHFDPAIADAVLRRSRGAVRRHRRGRRRRVPRRRNR